jgi:hypothetical protein
MCFSLSGTSYLSGSQITSWSDLSTSRIMNHESWIMNHESWIMNDDSSRVKKDPHPIIDARWTTRGREIGLTTQFDLLSTANCRRACEESNEDIWYLIVKCRESANRRYIVYTSFWNMYPADYLPYRRYRRKGFIGQSQQNCFVHFTEVIIFGR